MLNVNRIFIFFFIGLFSSSLYAVDVSSFDIKGIKLGMSKKEITNKLEDIILKNSKRYGKSWTHQILKNKRDGFSLGAEYVMSLNHNEKLLYIAREIIFKYEPNFSKVKEQIIKKYGKPDKVAKSKNNQGDFKYEFCWGHCTIENAQYWQGNEIWTQKKSFKITYRKYSKNDTFYMLLTLDNEEGRSKEDDWDKLEYENFLNKEKEKASNIDF